MAIDIGNGIYCSIEVPKPLNLEERIHEIWKRFRIKRDGLGRSPLWNDSYLYEIYYPGKSLALLGQMRDNLFGTSVVTRPDSIGFFSHYRVLTNPNNRQIGSDAREFYRQNGVSKFANEFLNTYTDIGIEIGGNEDGETTLYIPDVER